MESGAWKFSRGIKPTRTQRRSIIACEMHCFMYQSSQMFSEFGWSIFYKELNIKTPRKPASENAVCLCRPLNILATFSMLFLLTGKQCGGAV